MKTASEIRQEFLDFFVKKHGHTLVPSSPVVPVDDETLLFTNAGMNQFKDVFLGVGSRPFNRAVDTQKCIRAGGKHNDLDDVGKDTYHHTFFEMLGNWSFGDYFKKEAIQWAWELLTDVWGLDRDRLHATIFEGDKKDGVKPDEEAYELWKSVTDIDPSHIHRGNKKDNFWEMGDTGPCGPCSELHYDMTPKADGGKFVNKDRPDVIEIWNLVFIQFNRGEDRALTPLPAKHVDTGMGFERITAVLQGKTSNYDTDLFTPLFDAIQKLTGADKYTGKLNDKMAIAYRVIADHLRALTFSLNDGAVPSNEKRGYVVRSILRRAERFGYQVFGTTEPFLHQLIPNVIELMGNAFPELKENPQRIQDVVRKEEESFLRTLDRGITLFQNVVNRTKKKKQKTISGKDAFDLHTTHGLFVDITEQMAEEENLTVDRNEFERLIEEHQTKSGEGQKKVVISAIDGELPTTDDSPKYGSLETTATVLGWVLDNKVSIKGKLNEGEKAAILVDQTNFYAEQGGQIGDKGIISTPSGKFTVTDTQRLGEGILHLGRVSDGTIEVNQSATLEVQGDRAAIMKNHTTTHLLNWALRKVLGTHVDQKGSLVDAEKTRFDFTHDKALTSEEIEQIEQLVNERIQANLSVTPKTMPLQEAKQIQGVRAVFGEKYPDPVRVLMIGPDSPENATAEHSIEFCGGTHLSSTGEAGLFKIVSQGAVGEGVRRVTGVTGRGAVNAVQQLSSMVDSLVSRFNCKPEEIMTRVDAMQEEIKKLKQQIKKGVSSDLKGSADKLFDSAEEVEGVKLIIGEMPVAAIEQMREQMDRLKQKAKSGIIVLGWAGEGKVQLLCGVTDDLTKKAHAGKLIGEVAKVVDGRGGGKPNMAQAGGKDPSKLSEAMQKAKELAKAQIQ